MQYPLHHWNLALCQAYRVFADGKEEPYGPPFSAGPAEALAQQRSLNESRTEEEIKAGITYRVRRVVTDASVTPVNTRSNR